MLELEQLAALIDPLVSDMKAAEAELNHGDVQFRRRSFVRAFFALIEASYIRLQGRRLQGLRSSSAAVFSW